MGRDVVQSNLVRIAIAAALLAATAFYEARYGFRLGQAAGWRAENLMGVAIVLASTIVVGPLVRTRLGLAAGLTFLSTFILWAINAHYSTSLDVRYGGAYHWTGERIAVLTWLIGPVLGVVSSILVVAIRLLSKLSLFAPRTERNG